MSRNITLGQYLPGDTFMHRLNPRFKLLSLLFVLTALFWLKTFTGMGILLLLLILLTAAARVPYRYLLRGLRPILYIILFTLVIYLFFTKGGVVLLRVGSVTIEQAGLFEGVFIIARLIALVTASILVTLTTTPLALTHGLEFFLAPFKLIRLPVDEIAMIMMIALRFIPTLMEESQRLMRAQMARGADFETGNIFRKARNLTPLIVPLFVSAFRRADELALAMEARGYRIGARRTRMREETVTWRDWIAVTAPAALLAAVIIYAL
ncbi:MAG: energy-coupling factor transporter transmembrane protein EcfT [Bacillota bacterium]